MPLEVEPVRREASPLEPAPLTLSDKMLTCPEPERTPVPDTTETEPPTLCADEVEPATMFTEPPFPKVDEPERS